jgi:molybdopterin-guanine dinucleotide biosynthesis protein MobB
MLPVVSFVGTSNSGKTTLLCKVVSELKKRGYKVATIKHVQHLDIPQNKDNWKHFHAGGDMVIVASKDNILTLENTNGDVSIDLLLERIKDRDIVIVEGYKGSSLPKIEVIRKETFEGMVSQKEHLIAIAADYELYYDVPLFPINDYKGIAEFIEKSFLK